jgi:NADPH:quinone reductase-like Zn-dependent oxidoreductase
MPKDPLPRRDLLLVRVISLRPYEHSGSTVAFAGVVEGAGDVGNGLQPGDEVIGVAEGAFAGYVCVPCGRAALKPAWLTFEDATAMVISALRTTGKLPDLTDYTP